MSVDLEKGQFEISRSPLGPILIAEKEGNLLRVDFLDHLNPYIHPSLIQGFKEFESRVLYEAKSQLKEYFEGTRTSFKLPYTFIGTKFQIQAWKALLEIKYGETWSYQQQASWIGNPSSVRAVGQANGRNPLALIIPCHRVVGKNGSLTGYGSGIERKSRLLELERQFNHV